MNCRTHYIVSCEETSQPCQCCLTCSQLALQKVQYQNKDAYHFIAPRSISLKAAHNLLVMKGVKDFNLVGVSRDEIRAAGGQTFKRRAPVDQDSDEEVTTKQFRTSVFNGIKLEVSKESSKFNTKLQALNQKCKKLEKQQEKTFLEQAQTSRNVLRLIENQNILFQGFQNLTANSKEDLKKLTQATSQLTDSLKSMKNDQEKISELISKQTIKFEEGIKAMNFQPPQGQTRQSSTNLKTSRPSAISSTEKSLPKTSNRTLTDIVLNQIFGSSGIPK